MLSGDRRKIVTSPDSHPTWLIAKRRPITASRAIASCTTTSLIRGETSGSNRIARLTKLAGIKAQIGYKRRPGSYGGKA